MLLNFKKTLMAGTALVAATTIVTASAQAQTELTNGTTYTSATASLAAGFVESNGDATPVAVTIETGGAAASFDIGADATASFTNTSTSNLDINIGGDNDTDGTIDASVTFAGDVVSNSTGGIDIIVGGADAGEDSALIIEGNVTETTGAVTIVLGDGAGTDNNLLTIDSANDENLSIAAAITGTAGDTNAIVITDSDDGGNTVTFTDTVGDANVATITVGGNGFDTAVVFQKAVTTGTALTIGDGAGTDTDTVTFNTSGADFAVAGAINGAANDTAVINVTGGNTLTTSGAVGGTVIETVNITGSGTGLTTGSTLAATDINVGAGATLTTGGEVTGDIDFTGAGTVALGDDVGVSATIDNTTGSNGVGTLTIADATGGGNSVVGGNVGATNSLKAITLTTDGIAQFDGTVAATTITASAANGTLDFNGDVTGAINLSADAVVDLAADADITGAVNNTSGAAGAGTLTVATTGATNTISGKVGASNTLKQVNVAGTGTLAFSETVNAADVDFTGGDATVNFAKDVTVTNNIDFSDENGVINFADNADLTGNIIDTGDAEGNVNFAGSSTVTGNLGVAGANDLAAVDFDGGTGELVAVTGNIAATNVGVDGAGSVTVDGNITGVLDFGADGKLTLADTHSITGAITTTTDGEGTLVFAGAGSASSTLGAEGNELKALTLAGTNKTVTVGGNFNAADTTTIATNTLDVTGTVDVDAAQALSFTLNGATTSGQITSTGAATVDAATVVTVKSGTTNYVANGQTFTLIDGTGGAGVADLTTTILDDSFILSYTQVTANDADLVVTAARTSLATAATGGNNQRLGTVLEALGTGGDATLDGVQANVNSASTQAELDDVLSSLTPPVNGAAVGAGFSASTQSLAVNGGRLASLRDGSATGMTAGDYMREGMSMWVQGFGQFADQDERDGVDGYEADTYGLAVGVDSESVYTGSTVGIAFSYADSDVDSDGSNNTNTEIDSYQVSLYGDHDLDSETYLEAMLAYAYNDIDQSRSNVGGTGLTASADYDSSQYIAYAEVGRDYVVANETRLTPSVLAHYQHISVDDYTETGASGANLSVDNEDLDIFEIGVGAELGWDLVTETGAIVKPAVHVGYRYDLIGDEVESTSNFTGGGASFKSEGADAAESTFDAGFSVEFAHDTNWEFKAAYDLEVKEDYDAHAAYLRAGYKF